MAINAAGGENSAGGEAARRREGRLFLCLSLVWMLVIFAFSHQAYSGRITEEFLGAANIPVRKLGHVSEFGILSLLYFKTILCYFRQGGAVILRPAEATRFAVIALAMAFSYACLDEWHQSFVPGRSSSFTDVLVDTSGMIVAQAAMLIFIWRRSSKDPTVPKQ